MRTTPGFSAALAQLSDLYGQECSRLAEALRIRIQLGEFSGMDDEGPRYLRLAEELLATHPWLQSDRARAIAAASSRWFSDSENALGGLVDEGFQQGAHLCLAHDVLAEAARRGWIHPVRRLSDVDLYEPARSTGRRHALRSTGPQAYAFSS